MAKIEVMKKGIFLESPMRFEGMRVTVMGLGLFGGGAGITRFLVKQGARVTVTDLRREADLAQGLALIEDLPVQRVFGEHRETDFRGADLVIVNPAVPPESPFLKIAAEAKVPLETEINLLLRLLPTDRVIGVTGSNGKTTTAHLAYILLTAAGERAWLGGNVGGSLLPELDRIGADDSVVLELSSFQLERIEVEKWGPQIGVLTNLTPNHLDRHGTFEAYVEAKARIFKRARAAVLNAGDPVSMDRFACLELPGLTFSSRMEVDTGYCLKEGYLVERLEGMEKRLLPSDRIRLPGKFNRENLMAAMAAVRLLRDSGPLPEACLDAGAAFGGVPHRLEEVARKEGVRYINDSIATTPDSCMAALEALGGDILLIAGGYDKKIPLEALGKAVAHGSRAVFLVGATAGPLESAIRKAGGEGGPLPEIVWAGTIPRAIEEAHRRAGPGSTVLLSPGFASYDQFLNFVERGDCFRSCVAAL